MASRTDVTCFALPVVDRLGAGAAKLVKSLTTAVSARALQLLCGGLLMDELGIDAGYILFCLVTLHLLLFVAKPLSLTHPRAFLVPISAGALEGCGSHHGGV